MNEVDRIRAWSGSNEVRPSTPAPTRARRKRGRPSASTAARVSADPKPSCPPTALKTGVGARAQSHDTGVHTYRRRSPALAVELADPLKGQSFASNCWRLNCLMSDEHLGKNLSTGPPFM